MAAILGRIQAAGITLSVDGGNLVATPKAALTDELRSLIRTHKGELLEALAAPAVTEGAPRAPANIAGGDISLGTVQRFEAAAIAREAEDLKEFFGERAGILEFDAGLPRPDAEIEAGRITTAYARNRGYLWASLRAALASYPSLLAQLPDTDGPVDALPLGTAKVAVLKGQRVVRQGAFAGAQEVKV